MFIALEWFLLNNSSDRSEDLGLAAQFISSAKENCLFDVLDPQVVIAGRKGGAHNIGKPRNEMLEIE